MICVSCVNSMKLNALHELAELCELLLVASKLLSHSIKTVVTLYWTE